MKRPKNLSELILWQDDDFLLVGKPAGISTLFDRSDPSNLLSLIKESVSDAQVCHRLDKETSGVLAVAKHPKAYRHMSMQFEHRQVSKVYHAVVDGTHNFNQEEVTLPILKLNNGLVRISHREGKDATTYFSTLATYRHHTLVECRPVTGRMHQIRIHLSSLGAPIAGDEPYGGKPVMLSGLKRGYHLKKQEEEKPLIPRMSLHAYSLEFEDLKGNRQLVSCPYPKDISALVRQLTIHT